MIHDVEVSLQIWDTAGQERFHQGGIGAAFFRGAHGALLVYDVNDERSIEQIPQWGEECISRQDNDEFFPIVVIANKVDIRDTTSVDQRVDVTSRSSWPPHKYS
jgi:Ras-related protein Rab-7A